MEKNKNIYIVVSATDSIVAKIIRKVTGDKYSHSSISLDDGLAEMYSFGRIQTHNPFYGGFVKESVSYGAMKRFKKSEIAVLRFAVSEDKFNEIGDYLSRMYEERKKYKYNYIGLFRAKKGKRRIKPNAYYCSEFIRELLVKFELVNDGELPEVVRPIEFLDMKGCDIIYRGRLCDFAPA